MLTANQLQHFIDSLQAVVFSMDKNGCVRFVNNVSVDLLGYAPEELIGISILDKVVEEDREKTVDYINRLTSSLPVSPIESRLKRKDGTVVPVFWSGRWNSSDQKMYLAIRDISEQHQLVALKNQYEQELRQRNLEMFEMLERITDGFFALDKEWRFIYGNSQLERILNISREDYLFRRYWDCFPEMVDSIYYQQYNKAMRENVDVHFEAYFPPFDKWFSVDAYPSATGLSVFFRDISEKKRGEEQRKKYEETIAEQSRCIVGILERMDKGFVSLNTDLCVLYYNNQAEEIIGLSPEEVMGKKISELFCEEAYKLYYPLFQKVLTEQKSLHTEHICPQSHRWVEVNIYPAEEGISAFFTDVDKRKKTEMQIRKLSLVAEQTDNIVILTDREGHITWVNNAFTKTTGYSFEEANGHTICKLLHGPESDSETMRFMQEQFKKGKSFSVEIVNYTKDKKKYWIELSCQPLYDDQGKIDRFFTIERDITERKRMEQVLDEEKQQRQHMITAATIAAQENERAQVGRELHDNVNQVLTTVKLYQELCLNGIGNQQELLKRSMTLLQDSIDEIRNLSKRLSAPSLGNIHLKESLKELVNTITTTNKIDISVDFSGIADMEVSQELHLALYRIIQEHLTNVLKHAEAKHVQISFKMVDEELILKITDDGKGFDVNEKRSGIGIANMITRAESVKGKLVINSAIGLGCVLLVQIPLRLH